MERITISALVKNISNEGDAYGYLETLRWPNGPVCPHCGHTRAYFLNPANNVSRATRTGSQSMRRVWKCASCRKQFSVITGTIFHGSKVSLQTWLFVFFEMCSNKNGLAAREVARKYGVAPKTAWYMTQRIRAAMANTAPGMMTGVVVADETWIGGDPERMNKKTRDHNKKRHHTDKQPVVTLISTRTGEARSMAVTDVSGSTIRKVMAENVNRHSAILHTDQSQSYATVGRGFVNHQTVNHSIRQYMHDGATTNQAENFFSQLKRSLDGTHHRVSRRHLNRYLAEFDFRYSTHHIDDTQRVHRLMGQTDGIRMTYKRGKKS